MKTHLDCIPCFMKQSLEAARMTTETPVIQEKVLKAVMKHLQNINFEDSPPELSREVHSIIRELTKNNDPYKNVKVESNKTAEKIYNDLKRHVENADDPLLMAIKLAIAGNVIDFGAMNRFNVEDMIDHALHKDFDTSSYQEFKKTLDNSENILYLADNCGEIFFDKLLLEELKKMNKKITYVVKSKPILNDAVKEDAYAAGISDIAEIIACDDGQDKSTPGVVLEFASDVFHKKFKNADMVISKGQGNYEGLSDCSRKVFFLLVAKCPLVARDIQTDVGTLILKVKK
jgi:damage-control phosphatase, subfamily I